MEQMKQMEQEIVKSQLEDLRTLLRGNQILR